MSEKLQPRPPIVKLLTLWVYDYDNTTKEPHDRVISHGIWETIEAGLEEKSTHFWRFYKLRCVMPFHQSISVGDTRTMYESTILALCHQVTIQHLPKVSEDQYLNKV